MQYDRFWRWNVKQLCWAWNSRYLEISSRWLVIMQLVSNHLFIYTSLAPFQYIFRDHCLKFTLLTNRFEIRLFCIWSVSVSTNTLEIYWPFIKINVIRLLVITEFNFVYIMFGWNDVYLPPPGESANHILENIPEENVHTPLHGTVNMRNS